MADTIDINVYPTVETVTFEVTENLTTVNINQVASTGAVTSVNGLTGAVTLAIPEATSDLTNDSGFITSADLSGLVPYTGATTGVDLGGQNFEAHSIVIKTNGDTKKMTLSSTNVDTERTAEWQNKDYTGIADISDIPTNTSQLTNDSGFITDVSGKMDISIYDTDASGVVDNAEKMTTIGRNATASILYKGTIVYISGSTGNRPNFVKAQANSEATSSGTFGVCIEDIAINSDGRVATIGTLGNLDTRSTATHPFTSDTLADGDTLYLSPSTAGYVTNTKPSAPNHLVYIGKVARTSPTLGTIVYRMQNGYELDEIHDVSITSKANNDVLQYESATSLWKNKALTTASVVSSTDKNYVTDAQLTILGNTSGTNSGDNATNSQYSGLAGRINQEFFISNAFSGTSPSDNTTYYLGPSSGLMAVTEANRRWQFPYATTIRTAMLSLGQSTAGSNETVSVYLRNSTAGTETLVGTFTSNFTAGTGAHFNFSGLSIAIPNTTDYWTFKIVCPTWATNPTAWTGSFFVIAN